jgi:hypothetical protein
VGFSEKWAQIAVFWWKDRGEMRGKRGEKTGEIPARKIGTFLD